MEVYLIRHGETESNKQRRYLGWTESPLTELGKRQAEMAAAFLAAKEIGALYCSDLQRARATANVIGAGCGLKPVASPLLREIHFGRWEGLTFDEIEAEWGDQISRWLDDPFRNSTPDGETLAEVCDRMSSFLAEVEASHEDGRRIAIVSHGGSIRALLFEIIGFETASFWDLKIGNASVSLIRREGDSFRVEYYNRLHHLSAGSDEELGEEGYPDDYNQQAE